MDLEWREAMIKKSPEELLAEMRSLLSARLEDENAKRIDHAGELGNDKDHLEAIEAALSGGQEPTSEDVQAALAVLRGGSLSPDQLDAYYGSAISRGGISELIAPFVVKEMLRRDRED